MKMFRTIGIVVVCVCLIAGVGLYFKWFTISGSSTDVRLSTDKNKVDKDVNAAKDEVHKVLGDKTGDKTMVGTIQEIEAAKEELTVRDYRNQDVRMKLDPATKIKIIDQPGSFSDLKFADPVSVTYETNKDGNVVRTITVAKKL
jgi:hypothetical protein